MIHFEHYRSGQVYGIRYTIEHAEDMLPVHSHPPELAHNIIVMKGRVILSVAGQTIFLNAGDVKDFDWQKQHTVIARDDDTRVLHIFLNGMPEGYDKLPAHELKGIYD